MGLYTSPEGEKYIVTEVNTRIQFNSYFVKFMSKGDLLSLLRRELKDVEVTKLTQMARQAALGMVFLEGENVVHRDLALRNFLVGFNGNNFVVKISDVILNC